MVLGYIGSKLLHFEKKGNLADNNFYSGSNEPWEMFDKKLSTKNYKKIIS